MNTSTTSPHFLRQGGACLILAGAVVSAHALTLAEAPLFLGSSVKPNLLVIYDNSYSMEALLPGTTGGSDPTAAGTRGNTARRVLRQNITDFQSAFRWGLEAFAMNTPLSYPNAGWDPDYPVFYYSSSPILGVGEIRQQVQDNSTTHYNALMSLLGTETTVTTTSEIKNGSIGTPLPGALRTARQYFGNQLTGLTTPIIDKTCQKSFVVLATDGDPTIRPPFGSTAARAYTATETYRGTVAAPQYSTADTDIFDEVTALRSTTISNLSAVNGTYDIKTYVIGLGDVANNPLSVRSMNRMAELGGTGAAYLAADEDSINNAFSTITTDIAAQASTSSSVTLNTGSWNTGTKIYQARFNSGDWSGQLLAFSLASNGTPATTASWDAATRLNAQHWSTGRNILTYKSSAALGSRGVALRWPANASSPTATEIDAAMVTALNKNVSGTTDGYGSQRLQWLRGNTARETRICTGCSAPVFRSRPTTVLGDIVNSAPLFVNGGGRYVRDSAEAASYSAYKSARMAKTPLVFAGANDGMLHAFNANTGDEVFAYVPGAVTSRLSLLTAPTYSHRFTVDGALTAGDVFYGSAWHTLLVGGFGAGVKGLFALDVSDPSTMDEAHANSVVRWETASDADIGHIFGEPVLAKMKNGKWMAIVGNGYNSTNGVAKLLLIDVETGAVTKVSTQSGSTTTPNGLSSVVAVSSANNGVADIVYAGDLAGNLWRFDLSSTSTSSWAVAYNNSGTPAPLYAAGSSQPITARPDVSVHPSGGYMVVFGTGRYVDIGDDSTTTGQSLYGLWDSGSAIAASSSLVSQSVLGTATGGDSRTYRMTTYAVGAPSGTTYTGDNVITSASYGTGKRGWKIDLPASGERIVTQSAVRYGKVVVSTLIPSPDACAAGGDGWVMELDLLTGNRPNTPALDSNGDNNVTDSDALAYAGGSAYASGVRIGAIPAAPGFIRAQDRRLDDKLVNTSAGTIVRVREAGNTVNSGRVSWEQLQ